MTSATGRPGHTESPSRYSGMTMPGPKKLMPSRFSLIETVPSSGAFNTRLSINCCARCIPSIALFRFSCTTASDA